MYNILQKLYEIYVQAQKMNIKPPSNLSTTKPEFGDVVEIYHQKKIFVVVCVGNDEYLLMSEYWEFASDSDLIVDFNHAFRDKWIVELDKRLYVNPKKYIICGKLCQDDIDILKQALKGMPLPVSKTGVKSPFNPKSPLWKFKKQELKKTLVFNKHLFFEEDTVIIHFNFKSSLFEKEKKAAADQTILFEKNGAKILIEEKEVTIDVGDDNVGKSAKIYLSTKKPFILFEGIIEHPTFVIKTKNAIKNPHSVYELLNIEIYEH